MHSNIYIEKINVILTELGYHWKASMYRLQHPF